MFLLVKIKKWLVSLVKKGNIVEEGSFVFKKFCVFFVFFLVGIGGGLRISILILIGSEEGF